MKISNAALESLEMRFCTIDYTPLERIWNLGHEFCRAIPIELDSKSPWQKKNAEWKQNADL